MQTQYQDYPKVMKHPSYRPAVPYKQPRFRPGEEGWGKPVDPGQTGKPAQFADVTVHNLDQEQQYAAKGYRPVGTSDPEAYRRAMTNNEPKPADTFSEYPKMLYRRATKPPMDGGEFETRTVKSDAEESEALKGGWALTPGEARDGRRSKAKASTAAKPSVEPAADPSERKSGRGRAKTPEAEAARREKIRASAKHRSGARQEPPQAGA